MDMPNPKPVRNPSDVSPYYEDARDRQRQQERKEPLPLFPHLKPILEKRDATSQLERYIRALATESAKKPRWQKIIEHANSLADELGVSRERFYWMALADYIEKLENARVTSELNDAYKHIDREDDVAFLNRLVSYYD